MGGPHCEQGFIVGIGWIMEVARHGTWCTKKQLQDCLMANWKATSTSHNVAQSLGGRRHHQLDQMVQNSPNVTSLKSRSQQKKGAPSAETTAPWVLDGLPGPHFQWQWCHL